VVWEAAEVREVASMFCLDCELRPSAFKSAGMDGIWLLEVLVSGVVELRLGGFESSSRGSEISRESRFLWEVLLRREKLSWLRYSGSVLLLVEDTKYSSPLGSLGKSGNGSLFCRLSLGSKVELDSLLLLVGNDESPLEFKDESPGNKDDSSLCSRDDIISPGFFLRNIVLKSPIFTMMEFFYIFFSAKTSFF